MPRRPLDAAVGKRTSADNQNSHPLDQPPSAALRRRFPRQCPAALWPIAVGFAAIAFCAPFMHAVFWLGDEGVLLTGADRILRGERLYLDFFEFLPPSGFLLTAVWFAVAGISLWSARLLTLLTITGIACLTYLACREACQRGLYPVLLIVGWLAMTQGHWTEVSHQWLTTLLSMATALAAFSNSVGTRQRLREPLIAGLAGGAAATIVPSRGALAIIAGVVSFTGSRRQLLAFVLGTTVVPLAVIGYLAVQQTITAAFDDVILFTGARYASIQWVQFGSFAMPQDFPLKYLFPLTALLALFCCVRDGPACLLNRRLRCCVAFGIAGFAGIFPRADTTHIKFAAPLILPLFAYCTTYLTGGPLRRWRYVGIVLILLVLTVPAISFGLDTQQALRAPTLLTVRGPAAFLSTASGAESVVARVATTDPDERYFFYPFMPMLSFLTGREQTSRYDVFAPGYMLPSQYREACIAVMQNASWILIDRKWTDPDFLRRVFPAMRDIAPDETRTFELALETAFALVARYDSFELRRRTLEATDTLCPLNRAQSAAAVN
jgi:hypothetical protein